MPPWAEAVPPHLTATSPGVVPLGTRSCGFYVQWYDHSPQGWSWGGGRFESLEALQKSLDVVAAP